jgi:hypothetical protein
MNDRMKIVALGAFLALGAIMVGVTIWNGTWPTPTISAIAGVGSHLFVAYTMFMGALFAAYSLPIRNRAFAIFGILAAATVLAFVVINIVPLDEMNRLLAAGLTLSLLAALAIYSLVFGSVGPDRWRHRLLAEAAASAQRMATDRSRGFDLLGLGRVGLHQQR